tara:strand:+ start:22144 stop:22605 length:462 start_codon:yes stop_codon:yes gene_type:complete
VLDHVEAGRILEQPARKDLAEIVLGPAFLDQHLHETARFLGHFPRRGALAGLQADDHIADPLLLAGAQFEVLADIVALVEQAERGDTLCHRRAQPRFGGGSRGQFALLQFLGNSGRGRIGGRVRLLVTGRDQRRRGQEGKRPAHRHASGDQAS